MKKVPKRIISQFIRWLQNSDRGRNMTEFICQPYAMYSIRSILESAADAGYEIEIIKRESRGNTCNRFRFKLI